MSAHGTDNLCSFKSTASSDGHTPRFQRSERVVVANGLSEVYVQVRVWELFGLSQENGGVWLADDRKSEI